MQIQQCRGVESFELNDEFIVVQNPIESVAKTFSQEKRASLWERDIYDGKINIIGPAWVIFQFRGHSWTLIYYINFHLAQKPEEDSQMLSRLLNARTLYYSVSDTCYYISYQLYEGGVSVERLEAGVGVAFQFQSQLRQFRFEEPGGTYRFTDSFLKEQEIYIPALFWPRCELGQRVTLTLEGHVPGSIEPITFEREHFERVDYMATAQLDV
jgi:hypothetical protein